jgi:hypothetical protein
VSAKNDLNDSRSGFQNALEFMWNWFRNDLELGAFKNEPDLLHSRNKVMHERYNIMYQIRNNNKLVPSPHDQANLN